MCLVSSFEQIVQPLSETMTAPTFETFQTPLTGWGLASRRLVTRMILAAGTAAMKHYSSCHRFFSQARRSRDQLGLALRRFGEVPLISMKEQLGK